MSEAFIVPPHDPNQVVYRGEFAFPDIDSIMSWGQAIYFGSQRTANIYAEMPNKPQYLEQGCTGRVYPVRLTINNPVVNQPKNPYLDLDEFADRFGVDRAVSVALKFSDAIKDTSNWMERINPDGRYSSVRGYLYWNKENVKNLYFDAFQYFAEEMEIYWLRSLGYDGAIHQGTGWGSAEEPEYCVFDKSQIRSIFE
jgi:hypothetical protein